MSTPTSSANDTANIKATEVELPHVVSAQEHTTVTQSADVVPPHVGVPIGYTQASQLLVERRLIGKRLKPEAWLCSCVLLFLFWPLACVPCCLDACKEEIYEDVYITPPAILAAPQPQQIFVTHTHVQANV